MRLIYFISLTLISSVCYGQLKDLKVEHPFMNIYSITDRNILRYAESALGVKYKLGASQWSADKEGKTDCVGLAMKAWEYPIKTDTNEPLELVYKVGDRVSPHALVYQRPVEYVPGKLFTDAIDEKPLKINLFTDYGYEKKQSEIILPWSITSVHEYDNLLRVKPADAFNYCCSSAGNYGHILLVKSVESKDTLVSIEAVRPHVKYKKRTLAYLKSNNYNHLVRDAVIRTLPVKDLEQDQEQKPKKNRFHIVKSGDTLSQIAYKYHITVNQLISFNPNLKDTKSLIIPGDKLYLSKDSEEKEKALYYEVKSGDSLWRISQHFNVSMNHIIKLNDSLTSVKSLLTPGMKIRVK